MKILNVALLEIVGFDNLALNSPPIYRRALYEAKLVDGTSKQRNDTTFIY